MKNQFMNSILKAVAASLLLAGSGFAAANGNLEITAVSNSVIHNDTNPMHMDALVSVVDSNGAPVTGVTFAQFQVNTEFAPKPNTCGAGLLGVKEEAQKGFYTITLATANQCKWQVGDYLLRVAIFLGNAQGQAPLQLKVTLVPPQGWQ